MSVVRYRNNRITIILVLTLMNAISSVIFCCSVTAKVTRRRVLFFGKDRMNSRVELDVIDNGHRRRLYSGLWTPPQCVMFAVPLHRRFDDRTRRILCHPPAIDTGQGPIAKWARGEGRVVTETWPECHTSPGDGTTVQFNNNIIVLQTRQCPATIIVCGSSSLGPSPIRSIYLG